jgi:hypothetical protein
LGIKRSLTVAAALAAVLLVPVLVIIALGVYCEAIGIRTADSADGGPAVAVVSDFDGPLTIRAAPLPGAASWIWADSDGPWFYAGGTGSMIVSVLDVKSLEIVDRYSTEGMDAQTDTPVI